MDWTTFFSWLSSVRAGLKGLPLNIGTLSYWDFIMALAFLAVVISLVIPSIRVGNISMEAMPTVGERKGRRERRKKQEQKE